MSGRGPGGIGGAGVVGVTGACHLFQLPAPFQHSIVSGFSHEDGRPHVAFHQTNCGGCHGFIAFPHTLPASDISILSVGGEEQTIWTASAEETAEIQRRRRGGQSGHLWKAYEVRWEILTVLKHSAVTIILNELVYMALSIL